MNNTRVLASSEEVSRVISDMAATIIKDHHDSSPLFVALLRGAAPFTSQLMFELSRQAPEFHAELDYMMVTTYGAGRTAGEPHIVTDLAPDTTVKGRTVIILDDVLDKGVTANFVMSHLQNRDATSVQVAVLCQKTVHRMYPIKPTYCGFTFGDEWLIGMGMDDAKTQKEGYRWLDDIRSIS